MFRKLAVGVALGVTLIASPAFAKPAHRMPTFAGFSVDFGPGRGQTWGPGRTVVLAPIKRRPAHLPSHRHGEHNRSRRA
jgi:hypothetical protein